MEVLVERWRIGEGEVLLKGRVREGLGGFSECFLEDSRTIFITVEG